MLPKKKRLTRAEFSRFFSVGKRLNTPLFQCIVGKNQTFHASVVVSKKISPRAVVRNKLRRRIYDIVRNYIKDTRNGHGIFIFIMKPEARGATFDQLKALIIATMNART